jgi:acetylornithine deacetylase/succinyl-diaminopimelate desuccinylase-like protein
MPGAMTRRPSAPAPQPPQHHFPRTILARRAAAPPVLVMPMMGASVPLHEIAEILKVPVIGLSIVNHDNNQHASNENLRLRNLWDGIDTYAGMLAELN